MVNGSDAYGSFFSMQPQPVQPLESVVFHYEHNVKHLELDESKKNIKILIPGMYLLNLTAQFDQPSQVAFFINDIVDPTTVTASNSGAHIVTVHQLFSFNTNDMISFRNYISNVTLTTSIPASGTIVDSQNIDFTINRIASLPNPDCPTPIPNTTSWCYFHHSDSSDTEDCIDHNCIYNNKENNKENKDSNKKDNKKENKNVKK